MGGAGPVPGQPGRRRVGDRPRHPFLLPDVGQRRRHPQRARRRRRGVHRRPLLTGANRADHCPGRHQVSDEGKVARLIVPVFLKPGEDLRTDSPAGFNYPAAAGQCQQRGRAPRATAGHPDIGKFRRTAEPATTTRTPPRNGGATKPTGDRTTAVRGPASPGPSGAAALGLLTSSEA